MDAIMKEHLGYQISTDVTNFITSETPPASRIVRDCEQNTRGSSSQYETSSWVWHQHRKK